MYIKIRQTTADAKGLYEAVRRSWTAHPNTANQAKYVLAVIDKIVQGVFADCKWGPSTEPVEGAEGRSEFVGTEVDGEKAERYLNKRIPAKYYKKGMATPFSYSWTVRDPDDTEP